MGVLIVIFSLVLAAVVVMMISGPVRAAQRVEGAPGETPEGEAFEDNAAVARRAELEAAREAKYREIRDTELDYRTGKLSETDYGAIDGQLRAEALKILNELESLSEATQADDPPADPAES
jgi:hypothetical protein